MIKFSSGELAYPYTATWDIKPMVKGKIHCSEVLTLSEVEVRTTIFIVFFNVGDSTFDVTFDNDEYGMLTGSGHWDEKIIKFELYDIEKSKILSATYQKQKDETYHIHDTLLMKNGQNIIVEGTLCGQKVETRHPHFEGTLPIKSMNIFALRDNALPLE